MIGVIVLSGPFPGMHGLDAQRSPSLLPLGDRPALQHIVESLVTQGITCIELIVGHAPERVEYLLGNGDRWGCRFRYHLAAQPDHPYRSLRVIPAIASEPWVLIHAEQYPCVDFSATADAQPVLYYGSFRKTADQGIDSPLPASKWGGTVLMPPTADWDDLTGCTYAELREHFQKLAADGAATIVTPTEWVDVSTPLRLLQSQAALLDKKLRGLLISGTERQPGIWVSRNVTIHPSATLIPPIYIGPNSRLSRGVRLGPHAVIGADCIIDSKTSIDDSLVLEGSYVGEGLEVRNAIVAHNLLVNVRLDASVDVSEDFLLGRLDRPHRHAWGGRIVQSVFAVVLLLLCLPIFLVSTLYFLLLRGRFYVPLKIIRLPCNEKLFSARTYSLPALGPDAWSVHRVAGWGAFLRQFLPGLFAVIGGQLNVVGLPPRSLAEIEALSEDWRAIYLRGRAGLVTEAAISADRGDELHLYLADAYYSVQRSRSYDLTLAAKYFLRLIIPKRRQAGTGMPPASNI
jgi:NDP-sugar pyrophosphorylase family protein